MDNDGDGMSDYPDDPGCRATLWPEEDPACSDGQDNDGDGMIDGADPGCRDATGLTEAPQCNDGQDNDGDGPIDMADDACTAPYQNSERSGACGLGFELALLLPALAALRRRARAAAR